MLSRQHSLSNKDLEAQGMNERGDVEAKMQLWGKDFERGKSETKINETENDKLREKKERDDDNG